MGFELKGVKQIERALRELEKKVARQVVAKALRAGAKIIQAEVKAQAPVDTGRTKKALKVRAAKRKAGRVRFDVKIGDKEFQGKAFYPPMVELGHKTGSKRSKDRKKIDGKRFIRDAYKTKAEQARAVIEKQLKEGIEAAARKSA